ncbi:glycosyltransferase family 1 protein [uncultured Sulfitobacter sp.]|uniref:glycosyltransferase family 4 protein n=1 Tax=uncultured Sulfitobacter sp. TaxID=191468 RepID=UPI0026136E6C|nr:glycosyltransferase family 1 protein [uncultured Sulfitobacter sp.]
MDRVELAYLHRLVADPVPVYGLVRTRFGYLLLDPEGLNEFARRLEGAVPFSAPDALARMQRGLNRTGQQALTDLRKLAQARCLPRGLGRMLRAHLPTGTAYINTGHSNLTERVLRAVRCVADARIAVLVHDIIPLTHPQYQRAGTAQQFEAKLRRVQRHADIIIYNSQDTRERTERVLRDWGTVPAGIVAHLGTVPPVPDASALPTGALPDAPFFITIGTIEPRKNHALLLDIWDAMGPDAPLLLICGGRGWNNDAVFARLDALGPSARIKELGGLSDVALAALLERAQALLFPSHAEGFGLPAVEALLLGTPVVCSNLETFREILAENAVYIDDTDHDLWKKTIVDWSEHPRDAPKLPNRDGYLWDNHFKIALSFT